MSEEKSVSKLNMMLAVQLLTLAHKEWDKNRKTEGTITCPACNKLADYSIARNNGHARVVCRTCDISLME